MADDKQPTYTNLDVNTFKNGIVFRRNVPLVERAMIMSVINEVMELSDAASDKDLCITFERVKKLSDGFLGVVLDSPDTRFVTDDVKDSECVRIYICEDGTAIQEFNVIMSYEAMMSLIGNFYGFAKFTLKKFDTTSTASVARAAAPASNTSASKPGAGYGILSTDDDNNIED